MAIPQEGEKGYVIAACDGSSSFYLPDALHIERNDGLTPWLYKDDVEAAKAAERDGVKLIYGMENVEDGTYLDTPENRRVIEDALREKGRRPSIIESMRKINEELAAAPRSPTHPRSSEKER